MRSTPVVRTGARSTRAAHGELLAPSIQRACRTAAQRRAIWARSWPESAPARSPVCASGWSPPPCSARPSAFPAYGVCSLDAHRRGASPRSRRCSSSPTPGAKRSTGRATSTASGSTGRTSTGRPTCPTDGVTAIAGAGARAATTSLRRCARASTLDYLARSRRRRPAAGRVPHPRALRPSRSRRCYLRRPDAVAPGPPKPVTQ